MRVSGATLLLLTPLNALAAIFADLAAIRMAAGTSLAVACMQFAAMRHVSLLGQKLI